MSLWTIDESSKAFNNSEPSLAFRHPQNRKCHFSRNLLWHYLVASVINRKFSYKFLEWRRPFTIVGLIQEFFGTQITVHEATIRQEIDSRLVYNELQSKSLES